MNQQQYDQIKLAAYNDELEKIKKRRNNIGRGGYNGACGGTPRRDGSGGGIGNRGTIMQPSKS